MSTICEMCFKGMEYVGNVTDSLVLGHGTAFDKYYLLVEPCHSGDILCMFEETPAPDPEPDDEEEAEAAHSKDKTLNERSSAWVGVAERLDLSIRLSLKDAWALVEDMRQAGYDPEHDGFAGVWLLNRCGQLIEQPNYNEQ